MKSNKVLFVSILFSSLLWSGCAPSGVQNNTTGTRMTQGAADLERVVRTRYDANRKTVVLYTQKAPGQTGENIVDVARPEGVTNYVTAHYPDAAVHSIQVVRPSGINSAYRPEPAPTSAPSPGSALAAGAFHVSLPPRGVHMDYRIRPRAGLRASVQAKENAVMGVAKSKLGTPYIWGHNEDRGQYGFDCSNFTEYVYHHALGYRFTTSSRGQYRWVGVPVARGNMRVGDLLIFRRGEHVGIYAGNGRMIEEGGGLGRVGYLSLGPGSYWGKHLTSVRRMF